MREGQDHQHEDEEAPARLVLITLATRELLSELLTTWSDRWTASLERWMRPLRDALWTLECIDVRVRRLPDERRE